MKRHTNLIIKLVLTIIFACLIAFIFARASVVAADNKESENKRSTDLAYNILLESDYCYATGVWDYLIQRNYGKAITSAILGNMMVETAGGTLDIKPEIYSSSKNYYGLCQWSLKYHPRLDEFSFEHQRAFK